MKKLFLLTLSFLTFNGLFCITSEQFKILEQGYSDFCEKLESSSKSWHQEQAQEYKKWKPFYTEDGDFFLKNEAAEYDKTQEPVKEDYYFNIYYYPEKDMYKIEEHDKNLWNGEYNWNKKTKNYAKEYLNFPLHLKFPLDLDNLYNKKKSNSVELEIFKENFRALLAAVSTKPMTVCHERASIRQNVE